MDSNPQTPRDEQKPGEFLKVAECLYRNVSSGKYYALVKRAGKQYRRSLKTKDRKLAERFLTEFRAKVDRLDHTKTRATLIFAECATRWLSTVTPHMKPSSARRRETSVAQLIPHLGALLIRNMTANTWQSE